MRTTVILGALAGVIAAPLSAQQAPRVADMSSSVPASGRWQFAALPSGGDARFLDAASRPQLSLTCNRAARTITLARPASAAAPYLLVWTSSESRSIPASFNPATNLLSAPLQASDRLFDALAQSRGRIAVGVSGQPMLVAPAWAEIGRVVEECRL